MKEKHFYFILSTLDLMKKCFCLLLSDSLEPAQFTASTARGMPENPENGSVNKPVSASNTSPPAFKPTGGPQYAVKTSGWQPSNPPGKASKHRSFTLYKSIHTSCVNVFYFM